MVLRRMLDLFAGRLGWSRAFLARGWEVVAVDLVKPAEIPNGVEFVTCDVLQLGAMPGRIGVNAQIFGFLHSWEVDFVCVSSPCEQFSVWGMRHFHPNPSQPEMGIKLFQHAKSLCEKAEVPYIMENVRAAQQFVGKAKHHCGPFYLWGPGTPPLLPQGIKKGFQTGGSIIQKLKGIDRAALTAYRRLNDGSWSPSNSKRRKEWTAKIAEIPPELANCVADYAERLLESRTETHVAQIGAEDNP